MLGIIIGCSEELEELEVRERLEGLRLACEVVELELLSRGEAGAEVGESNEHSVRILDGLVVARPEVRGQTLQGIVGIGIELRHLRALAGTMRGHQFVREETKLELHLRIGAIGGGERLISRLHGGDCLRVGQLILYGDIQ